ncbi:MAG: hypothetical protein GX077_05065 [Tissierellia bacterium]|nr:hypothetical protein [Tissierellia bacterium]
MNNKVFIMENKHAESCGTPPIITNTNLTNILATLRTNLENNGYLCMTLILEKGSYVAAMLIGIMYLKYLMVEYLI